MNQVSGYSTLDERQFLAPGQEVSGNFGEAAHATNNCQQDLEHIGLVCLLVGDGA